MMIAQYMANRTAAHLAAALHDRGVEVSPVTVERWIAGRHAPQSRYLPAIADALGVSVDELLR